MKRFIVEIFSYILKFIFAVYSIPIIVILAIAILLAILFLCAFGILIFPLFLLFCFIDWLSELNYGK
jgi:hypothetical protein